MQISKGKTDEVDVIFKLLQACAKDMREKGIMQWNEHYPLIENVVKDIENEALYTVHIDGGIAGVIVFDDQQSPEYQEVSWTLNEGKVGVVHRLAVDPTYQGKGIARKLMDFIENMASQNGYKTIRLDAYSLNPRTLRFYQNRGYTKCGQIFFPYREDPFYCFERRLE